MDARTARAIHSCGRTTSLRAAKSCGPDTPTLVLSSQAYDARGRWGQSSPVPRESTKDTVKAIAQGMPDDSAEPVVPSPCFFIARGPWVAASTRHSLRPLISEGMLPPIARTRIASRECEGMSGKGETHSAVIARERRAIQYAAAYRLKHCHLWNTGCPAEHSPRQLPHSRGAVRPSLASVSLPLT